MQEEWNNGFVEGERPGCTYYTAISEDPLAFISNGVVYIWDWDDLSNAVVYSYDIAAKNLSKNEFENAYENGRPLRHVFMMNDTVYCTDSMAMIKAFDYNGILQKTVTEASTYCRPFDKGILLCGYGEAYLYSYDLEKIAEIPSTIQRDAAHGQKEDVSVNFDNMFAADGTVYSTSYGAGWCQLKLNTDTYKWEEAEFIGKNLSGLFDFCGKYVADKNGIYDRSTTEQVFEYEELYPPAHVGNNNFNLCYFGGDKYLGKDREGIRWVNLTNLSMLNTLPSPEIASGTLNYVMRILNDTYCVYRDKYGWFLWNYNTGEEETIVLFE